MSFWGNTWPLRQHISGSQLSFPDQQLASISYAVQHRMQQLNILLLYCSSWIGDKKYPLRCPSMCFLLYSFFFFFFTAPSLTCVWCRSSFWRAATTALLVLISSTLLGGKTLASPLKARGWIALWLFHLNERKQSISTQMLPIRRQGDLAPQGFWRERPKFPYGVNILAWPRPVLGLYGFAFITKWWVSSRNLVSLSKVSSTA